MGKRAEVPEHIRQLGLQASSVELIEEKKCINIDGVLRLELAQPYFAILFSLAKEMKRLSRFRGLSADELLRRVRAYKDPTGERSGLRKESSLRSEWREVIQGKRKGALKGYYAKYRFFWLGSKGDQEVRFDPDEEDRLRFLEKLFPRRPWYRISVPDLSALLVLEYSRPRLPGGTFKDFLSTLKHQGAPVEFVQYERFHETFVPPREYERIRSALETCGIVFVVGPPHVGKTFTAFRLLWHYYRVGGREPRWLLGKDWGQEPEALRPLVEPQASLAGWVSDNTGGKLVTYIEDPFGRISEDETKWERLAPSNLLFSMIDHVRRSSPNARVIVTSREKVFDRLIRRRPRLRKLVASLKAKVRLGTRSYGKKRLRRILLQHGMIYSCSWRESVPGGLVKEVEGRLDTPHAISLFCWWSRKSRTLRQCHHHISRAASELAAGFRNEIVGLADAPTAILLVSQYCAWADLRLPDIFAAGFPRLAGSNPKAIWQEACAALSHRVAYDEENDIMRLTHPSYVYGLLHGVDSSSRIRDLYTEMVRCLARASDAEMRQLAVCLLLKSLDQCFTQGMRTREARSLLRELAEDVGIVRLELARGLARACNLLGRTERALLRELTCDLEDTIGHHLHPIASGLASNANMLDGWGRARLKEYAGSESEIVRCAVASGLAVLYTVLGKWERRLLLQLVRDEALRKKRPPSYPVGLREFFKMAREPWEREAASAIRRAFRTDKLILNQVGTILADDYENLDEIGREMCDIACGKDHSYGDPLSLRDDGERDVVEKWNRKYVFGPDFDITKHTYGTLRLKNPILGWEAFKLDSFAETPCIGEPDVV